MSEQKWTARFQTCVETDYPGITEDPWMVCMTGLDELGHTTMHVMHHVEPAIVLDRCYWHEDDKPTTDYFGYYVHDERCGVPDSKYAVAKFLRDAPDHYRELCYLRSVLANIPDPAAFVARAKAIEEAARKAQDQLEYMRVLSSEEGEFYPNSSSECATRVAELTAALAMPGGAA